MQNTFLFFPDNRILRLSACGTSAATVCETHSRSVKGFLCNEERSFPQTIFANSQNLIWCQYVGTWHPRAQVLRRNSGKARKCLILPTSEGLWLPHSNSKMQHRTATARQWIDHDSTPSCRCKLRRMCICPCALNMYRQNVNQCSRQWCGLRYWELGTYETKLRPHVLSATGSTCPLCSLALCSN